MGVGLFAAIVGVISTTFERARLSRSIREELARFGAKSLTPSGILGFYFLFFVLAISLFACAQVGGGASRGGGGGSRRCSRCPSGGGAGSPGGSRSRSPARSRSRSAPGCWHGPARARRARDVSLPDMLGAGANCLPTALLFLALSALAFARRPRATSGIAYGLVSVAFVWQLFGAALGAPSWLLGASPFHHVGLVPAQSFKALAAIVMLALAAAALAAAFALFARRDPTGE